MDFEVENREKSMQKRFKKNELFFTSIFRRFWLRFKGSWGGFGEHFDVQNVSPKGKINFFNKIAIFKGFGTGLGRALGGFGEDLGGVLGGSGSLLGALEKSIFGR